MLHVIMLKTSKEAWIHQYLGTSRTWYNLSNLFIKNIIYICVCVGFARTHPL